MLSCSTCICALPLSSDVTGSIFPCRQRLASFAMWEPMCSSPMMTTTTSLRMCTRSSLQWSSSVWGLSSSSLVWLVVAPQSGRAAVVWPRWVHDHTYFQILIDEKHWHCLNKLCSGTQDTQHGSFMIPQCRKKCEIVCVLCCVQLCVFIQLSFSCNISELWKILLWIKHCFEFHDAYLIDTMPLLSSIQQWIIYQELCLHCMLNSPCCSIEFNY